jgi:hypothetical protein
MPETILSPGDPIQARCTKCKKNTDSIVISSAENIPEKVQCSLCSRKHKYRPPLAEKKPASKRATTQSDSERKQWQTLLANVDSAKTTDYSMTTSYKVKAVINHPVFGLGLVQRFAGPQKVEVLFESGKKMMRCK